MTHITVAEAQAWLESSKLTLTSLDTEQEAQIASQVLARVVSAYPEDAVAWVDSTTTPRLIRSIIAMMYAGWYYDRQYSENPEDNSYADRLRAAAESLLEGIIAGTIDVVEVDDLPNIGQPAFYPTDASSAPDAKPSSTDPSAGPALFSIGKVF
jgi:hypothetical protein